MPMESHLTLKHAEVKCFISEISYSIVVSFSLIMHVISTDFLFGVFIGNKLLIYLFIFLDLRLRRVNTLVPDIQLVMTVFMLLYFK